MKRIISSWFHAIVLVILYNAVLTIATWAWLSWYGYIDVPLNLLPVGLVSIGVTPIQAALYKLGKR